MIVTFTIKYEMMTLVATTTDTSVVCIHSGFNQIGKHGVAFEQNTKM